jgi:magnesium-transporting ATPase (P-type)
MMTRDADAFEKRYAHLHSSAQGLSQAEAEQRLARYGANRIEKISGKSFIAKLLQEFLHFFALILWPAAALAFIAEWRDPGRGMAMQVVNVIVCRHPVISAFSRFHRRNRLIGYGIGFELVWLFILPFGIGMLLEELRKAIMRSLAQRKAMRR